jgi:hypothetical protein
MRVSFALITVAASTKISSYDQGAKFDKCIDIDDFHTKTIDSDITLTDRDSNGCCAAGTVPGAFYFNQYQGSQIVCFKPDNNQNMGTPNNCEYGQCYVYKQDLPCEDDTRQHLNGCCEGADATQFGNFPENCLGYLKTFDNTHDETVKYCTTYHKTYGSIGRVGTTDGDDDTHDDGLNIACIDEYAACCDHIERNGKCTGDIPANYMKSNPSLTENQCSSVSRGASSGGDSDAKKSDSKNNSTDNAFRAGIGCTLALASAVAM